jgi:Ca2+-binding RTX toxin-like protein
MTIGTVSAGFPVGTDMDQIDVGLYVAGTNGSESSTSYTVTIAEAGGDEQLIIGGTGFTYSGAGAPTGGTVTSIQDQFMGQVAYTLQGFSLPVTQLQTWATAHDTASLVTALFSGADTLSGGPLDDVLRAYAGNDSIAGGAGNDILDGGLGNDTLDGGGGHDVITTGGGADVIVVGLGQSAVAAGVADSITDWNSSDILHFASGPAGAGDYVETTAADFASATTAANQLIASGTTNIVVVGVGADLVVFADSANNDGVADDAVVITGRGLTDISVSNITTSPSVAPVVPVTPPVTPPAQPPPTLTGGSPTLGPGDDSIVATATNTEIHTGSGNDTIVGATVADYLRGDDGNDSISGGGAFDDINGNMGNDTCHGNGGDDWVVGGKDNDMLFGDAGSDIVWGNLGNDTLDGGDGNDQVRGGQGDDVLNGGTGDDFISGDRGNDTETGGAGADVFHYSQDAGIDLVTDFHYAEGDRVMLDPGTTYTVSQVGADTVIDAANGNQMILAGVQLSSLPADWIFGA